MSRGSRQSRYIPTYRDFRLGEGEGMGGCGCGAEGALRCGNLGAERLGIWICAVCCLGVGVKH